MASIPPKRPLTRPGHPQISFKERTKSIPNVATATSLAHTPLPHSPSSGPLPLSAQLPRGRLIELMNGQGQAPFTTAAACLRYAQQQGETTAWVQFEQGPLFPPDLAESGIDLDALLIVQVPPNHAQAGLLKAAELLLRSGGFGMVVIDLQQGRPPRGQAWQGRLLSLAREQNSWVLLLGPASKHSTLGPLISLSIRSSVRSLENGHFALKHHVHKHKGIQLGPLIEEQRRGPWGL